MTVEALSGSVSFPTNGDSPFETEQPNYPPKIDDFPRSPREFLRFQTDSISEHLMDGVKGALDWANTIHEWDRLRRFPIYENSSVPRAKGETLVFVLGFGAADWMFVITMKNFSKLGHRVVSISSPYGFNITPTAFAPDRIMDFLESQSELAGDKVNVIAHSQGGHKILATYAKHRERFAGSVDQVVFNGSVIPFKVNWLVGLPYVASQYVFRGNDFGLVEMIRRDPSILDMEGVRGTFIYDPNEGITEGIPFCLPQDQFRVPLGHGPLLFSRENLMFMQQRLIRPRPTESKKTAEILDLPVKAAA